MQNIIRMNEVVGFNLTGSKKTAAINLATGGNLGDSANVKGRPRRYHTLSFKFLVDGTAATYSQMAKLENIKLEASTPNGDVVLREFDTAAELYEYNRLQGHNVAAGKIDLHFTDWLAKTDVEQGTLALGTSDITKLVISANLNSSHGLTSPTVSLIEVYDEVSEPMGAVAVVKKSNVNFGSTGKHYITQTDENLLGEGILSSIFVMNDKFTNVELELNKERLQDVALADVEYYQKVINKGGVNKVFIDTTNDTFLRDFATNSISNGIPMVGREFKLTFTTSASVNANVYYTLIQGNDDTRRSVLATLKR